jgi:hypothetical protein
MFRKLPVYIRQALPCQPIPGGSALKHLHLCCTISDDFVSWLTKSQRRWSHDQEMAGRRNVEMPFLEGSTGHVATMNIPPTYND